MSAGKCRLRRNGSTSMFHTRADFDNVIKAHNRLVDYCESLEKRVEELEAKLSREAADVIGSLESQKATCEVECFDDGVDEGLDGEWYRYAPPTWSLSCGHEAYGDECPKTCPECGAEVTG